MEKSFEPVFLAKVHDAASHMVAGAPRDRNTRVGPQILADNPFQTGWRMHHKFETGDASLLRLIRPDTN